MLIGHLNIRPCRVGNDKRIAVGFYFRDRIRSIFQLNDTPHRLALAFAVGVFIAFSPTFGLHIITCLIVAWMFRLSKLALITATFINNPWTIVPMYGFCIWFGDKLLGSELAIPRIAWNELTLSTAYVAVKPFFWPFITGTLAVGAIAAVIAYFLIYRLVLRYRALGKKGEVLAPGE
jgi:hypothetical protein